MMMMIRTDGRSVCHVTIGGRMLYILGERNKKRRDGSGFNN